MTRHPELLEAWRAVANSKLVEFRRQCLAQNVTIAKVDAVDAFSEITTAHALARTLGDERIELIVGEAQESLKTILEKWGKP
jgi:hypothetical protein